jgi:hypothetical protein
MIYIASGVFLVWLSVLYFLAGRSRKDIHLVLDNRAPGAQPSDFSRFGFRKLARNIDPTRLNEAGRVHLERAIRTEGIMFIWMVDVFLFVVLGLLVGSP